MDGEALLPPPPPLNGTGLYPMLSVIDWLQLAALDVDSLGFEDNPSDDISCSQVAFTQVFSLVICCVSLGSFVSFFLLLWSSGAEPAASVDSCLSQSA
ncbi:unnamed protein product [Brassica rapa]|uniref:Uncharacterized protein n=2 Tax=Brassica TaxID=3705 RepID=A0A3P6B604_BRACM|nr:unnamed protein product [Brassica napus]CAG7901232.1 unnamed protein product [Brassica rapa]VDC96469.1 unnamed protein product [Brassica rapa]